MSASKVIHLDSANELLAYLLGRKPADGPLAYEVTRALQDLQTVCDRNGLDFYRALAVSMRTYEDKKRAKSPKAP